MRGVQLPLVVRENHKFRTRWFPGLVFAGGEEESYFSQTETPGCESPAGTSAGWWSVALMDKLSGRRGPSRNSARLFPGEFFRSQKSEVRS
jgi:hypothetical protein